MKKDEISNIPLADGTESWIDENTNEVVTRCKVCNAMAWHTAEQLADFRFQHSPTCIAMREAGPTLDDGKSREPATSPDGRDSNADILLVERGLWEAVVDANRETVEARTIYAAAARILAMRLQSGVPLPTTTLDGLIARMTEVVGNRELDLTALREVRLIPQPAPLPPNLQPPARLGDAPVVAPKRFWDAIGNLTEGLFDIADELADQLDELVTAVEQGDLPDPETLAGLADSLRLAKEDLGDSRGTFRLWIGRLVWMPTEASQKV